MTNEKRICSIEGCDNPLYLKTFCNAHYLRWRRHGHPLAGAVAKGEPLKWLKQIINTESTECIEWPYANNGNGYGWAWYQSKRIGAHRLALVLKTGRNPKGAHASHYCHNRACVNPNHLGWHTVSENLLQTTRGPGKKGLKLNEAKARHIRESSESAASLAKEYGVSISSIYKVRKGILWK